MSRRSLLEALLSEEDYVRLYTEHSGFHFAVDGLLNMLPGLVAGMAGQALEDESRRVAEVQRLRDQPMEITWSASGGSSLPKQSETLPEPVPAAALPRPRKRAVAKAPAKKVAKRGRYR